MCSEPLIDMTVDAGDDGVVVTVSAKALRVDTRADLVIVGFAAVMIRGLVGGMIVG